MCKKNHFKVNLKKILSSFCLFVEELLRISFFVEWDRDTCYRSSKDHYLVI